MREDEVRGVDVTTIDIGLPVAKLAESLDDCLNGDAEVREIHLDAVTRRGRSVTCRVAIRPLFAGEVIDGAILVMELISNGSA